MTAETAAQIMMMNGGDGGETLLDYIINNSIAVFDITINSQFKFTANVICSDKMEFQYNGERSSISNHIYGTDSDGIVYDSGIWANDYGGYSFIYLFFVAYESNVPIFTTQCAYKQFDDVPYSGFNYRYYYDDERGISPDHIGRYFYCKHHESYYVENSAEFDSGNAVFEFDSNNIFQHKINLPNLEYQVIQKYFNFDTSITDRPIVIVDHEYPAESRLWTIGSQNIFPKGGDVYSNSLSPVQIRKKYDTEIVPAIYTAQNINMRTCLVYPEEV